MDEIVEFKKARLAWGPKIAVAPDLQLTPQQILALLTDNMTDERKERLQQVAQARSLHLVSVLENIYDKGNVSAVMRSAEAFGFLKMCLVDAPGARFKAANRVSKEAEKWLDVHSYHSPLEAVRDLKAEGYQVWATDLNTPYGISDLDWSKPTAVVLGNEKDGVSPEMLSLVDGRFRIPMSGFSQSFNISVAAALIFYHGHLQTAGLPRRARLKEEAVEQVLANYYLRCFDHPENILRAKLKKA